MTIEQRLLELLRAPSDSLLAHLDGVAYASGNEEPLVEQIGETLEAVRGRLEDNYPYPSPLYAGQMLKPPHPVARLAYSLAMLVNPNNHALDGGRASSAMEREAVSEIARMFGWESHLGHLTAGGTMANLEALWVSRELRPGGLVVSSELSHYTHERMGALLGMKHRKIAVDANGRMDIDALERVLRSERVSVVVATIGTTPLGSVDPLRSVLALRERFDFRVHADAAYGGYFTLAANLDPETTAEFGALVHVDSIVIDPHKHGLQPYGCGCVLFRDPSIGVLYKHDSPYTYFTSGKLHLGEISLECSRPGASAVALWATQRLLPLVRAGEFARGLEECRCAALALYEHVAEESRFFVAAPPDLDIVVWGVCGANARESTARARELFELCEAEGLYLARTRLPAKLFPALGWDGEIECLRSCLMKPLHRARMGDLTTRLDRALGKLNQSR